MLCRYCITEWILGLLYFSKAVSFGEMPDPTKRDLKMERMATGQLPIIRQESIN